MTEIDYISIMINSSFTGIGTAIGLSIYELFLKDKIHHIGTKIKNIKPKIKQEETIGEIIQ